MRASRKRSIAGCPLTRTELRVLRAFVEDPAATPGRLGSALGCSEHTIRTHLSNIHERLRVSTHTEMVLRAIQYGWASVPPAPPPDFVWRLRRHSATAPA